MVSSQSDAALKDRALMTQTFDRPAEVVPQRGQVCAADVPKVYPLQMPPDAFRRVQVRRVTRQLLQLHALRPTISEKLLHRLAAVYRRSVPDYQQLALDTLQQMLQKAYHIHATVRPLLTLGEQPAVHRDAADRRDMLTPHGHAQDRRLANRSVGTHHAGQQRKARLIYPDNGSPVAFRPLLSVGQRSAYQAAIFPSSRWVARRIGFWGLQRSAFRRRLTCVGW